MTEGKDLQKEKVKTKLEEFYRYPHKKEPKLQKKKLRNSGAWKIIILPFFVLVVLF